MSDALFFQTSRYTQPPLILLGTIGALLNQVLFYARKPLRSTSCALYFRALSINDLLVLYIVVLPGWLSAQFSIDPSRQSDAYCRLKTYVNNSLYTLSPYFIVLACLDRLCMSSTDVRLRRVATLRVASVLIPIMGILVFLAYFHVPIWYMIVRNASGTVSSCSIPNAIYLKMISLFLFVFLCVLPPTLMVTTCTITLILLRHQRQRIMPVNQARLRQRDNQLLKMLFIYVASHIVCTVPFTVTYVIFVFVPSGSSRLLLNLFRLFSLLFNVNFATSFYVYTLCTPFYRHELVNLLKSGQRRLIRTSTQGITNEGV